MTRRASLTATFIEAAVALVLAFSLLGGLMLAARRVERISIARADAKRAAALVESVRAAAARGERSNEMTWPSTTERKMRVTPNSITLTVQDERGAAVDIEGKFAPRGRKTP